MKNKSILKMFAIPVFNENQVFNQFKIYLKLLDLQIIKKDKQEDQ